MILPFAPKTTDPDGEGEEEATEEYYAYDQTPFSTRENASQMLFRFEGSELSDLKSRYLWAPVIDLLLSDEKLTGPSTPGDIYWALGDNLNTVRDIARYDAQTDTTTIVNHRVYDAYGKLTSETNGAVDLIFSFTGRLFDESTGLQNNLHRWYDPTIGRWLSEDPISFSAGDANLYRYVNNAPTTASDPNGLWAPMPGKNAPVTGRSSRTKFFDPPGLTVQVGWYELSAARLTVKTAGGSALTFQTLTLDLCSGKIGAKNPAGRPLPTAAGMAIAALSELIQVSGVGKAAWVSFLGINTAQGILIRYAEVEAKYSVRYTIRTNVWGIPVASGTITTDWIKINEAVMHGGGDLPFDAGRATVNMLREARDRLPGGFGGSNGALWFKGNRESTISNLVRTTLQLPPRPAFYLPWEERLPEVVPEEPDDHSDDPWYDLEFCKVTLAATWQPHGRRCANSR